MNIEELVKLFNESQGVVDALGLNVVEKCCFTCEWFERDFEESGCLNPKTLITRRDFGELKHGDFGHFLGAYGGIPVNEGCVCNLWEKKRSVK